MLLAPLLDIPLPAERAPNFGPEELRRRQLAAMVALLLAGARTQPVVLAFEDLHWADPTSLDLIQALAERGAQAPLLVVATARPEFRAPWGMRSHHAVVALAPLDRTEVRRMVGEIAEQHALPQEVVERVSERTGGVPLFVEEVTRLLLERGDTGSQAVPPTLQQSLAARLDRLGEAREVAQIGAVLGRDFAYSLLREVAEADEPTLQASLDRLADADLLFVEGAPPKANYRFKHALVRDAAYQSLLKSRRQQLHSRVAKILRDRFPAERRRNPSCLPIMQPRAACWMKRCPTGTKPVCAPTIGPPTPKQSHISPRAWIFSRNFPRVLPATAARSTSNLRLAFQAPG